MLRPEGEVLWRKVAEVGEFSAGCDVLEVGTRSGDALCFWAAEHGVDGTGVDSDTRRIRLAEEHARELGLTERVQFQVGSLDDLPFRDGSFDAVVGQVAIGQVAGAGAEIAELVRVARRGGAVILLEWTWAPELPPAQRALVRHTFGVRVRSSEEWQRHLAAEGVGDVAVHHVWDIEVAVPGDSLRARLGALPATRKLRAWGRFAGMVRRQREARRLLARGNVLGVTVIKGTKWPS